MAGKPSFTNGVNYHDHNHDDNDDNDDKAGGFFFFQAQLLSKQNLNSAPGRSVFALDNLTSEHLKSSFGLSCPFLS